MKEKQYNLKLTIKAICLFEQLTNIPFGQCMNNPEYILPLIYCVLVSHPENGFTMTYQSALVVLSNPKIVEPIAEGIKTEIEFLNQFCKRRDAEFSDNTTDNSSSTDTEPSSNEDRSVFLSDIIPILTSDCGLDINYIMNEMNYTDIDSFIHYRELKHQSELEEKRLFTYLTMAPHVDHKKVKKPEDILPFPWEKQAKQNKFNSEVKDITEKLKSLGIIKGGS